MTISKKKLVDALIEISPGPLPAYTVNDQGQSALKISHSLGKTEACVRIALMLAGGELDE